MQHVWIKMIVFLEDSVEPSRDLAKKIKR